MKENNCEIIVEYPKKHYYKYSNTIKKPRNYIPRNPPFELNDINTLLKFAKSYQKDTFILNHYHLRKIKKPLEKINNIVGLEKFKEEIFNLIIYLLLYHEKGDLLHIVLEGPPGTGKTKIAEILAELYSCLGHLRLGHIVKAKRTDFIGPFLGQTSDRTNKLIEKAKGGVLLIDEAYQLGNPGNKDSYSKECLDILNQALTENKDEFICIIAGYKDSLENSFFSVNPGLKRRFPYKFTLDKYTTKELQNIFQLMCSENGWTCDIFDIPNDLEFQENGGDMEKMFHFAKINHTRRVINATNFKRKHLTKDDIEKTYSFFKKESYKNEYMYL